MSEAIYMAEAALISGLMYGYYKYVYYSMSYYKWDLIYLKACIILGFVIPKIKIEYQEPLNQRVFDKIAEIKGNGEITYQNGNGVSETIEEIVNGRIFETVITALVIIYIAGILIKTVKLIISIKKIMSMKTEKISTYKDGIVIYATQIKTVAFSFNKSIYVSERFKSLSNSEQNLILQHEECHIREHHTAQTIFFEIADIILWFSPVMKRMKKTVKTICENIADREITEKGLKDEYSKLIIKLTGVSEKSEIKPRGKKVWNIYNRIAAIFSKDGQTIRKIRFISSLPVPLAACVAYILLSGMIYGERKGELEMPIKGNYRLEAEYFENRKFESNGHEYLISHREITITTQKPAEIIFPEKSIIKEIKQESEGTKEVKYECKGITITIKGIESQGLKEGEIKEKGEITGKTLTCKSVRIKTERNGKAENPQKIFGL